jgi:hypothetical protein
VLIKCGQAVFDLTGTPIELQTAAAMAVQRLVDAHIFLAIVHKTWPQLDAAARQLVTACGVG